VITAGTHCPRCNTAYDAKDPRHSRQCHNCSLVIIHKSNEYCISFAKCVVYWRNSDNETVVYMREGRPPVSGFNGSYYNRRTIHLPYLPFNITENDIDKYLVIL
jgi:hypothetical protein